MFNSLWQEMAGARVALTGTDGEVILAIEIGELPRTASVLRKLLGEWRDVAREWRTTCSRRLTKCACRHCRSWNLPLAPDANFRGDWI